MQNSNKRPKKGQLAVRLIAIVLAALMVLGVAYYTIVLLTPKTYAAEASDDRLISVGLMYGDGVTESYPVQTVGGVTVGLQNLITESRKFTELFKLGESESSFVVAVDGNLSYNKSSKLYDLTSDTEHYSVGGYHIELDGDFESYAEAKSFCTTWGSTIETTYGTYAFPCYSGGEYTVRIGDYPTKAQAEAKISSLNVVFNVYAGKFTAVEPSERCLTAVNPENDKIIFEIEAGPTNVLGVKPTDGAKYLKSPVGNIYKGVFAFKNYKESTTYGVEVINVLPLEEYVAGVLPYEVSNTWPLETLKAFAIAVRSFTVNNIGLHMTKYGFDMCSTVHCQAYRGAKDANDRVIQAVNETKGLVMTYSDKIITANYSSSVGGVTVSAADAWGGVDYPYAKPKRTPWEDYYNHASGFWIVEISPTQLLIYLRDTKGYKELKGNEIAEVNVLEYAKDSTYIKKIEFVDDKGNSVTVTNTDNVRSVLSSYVKSSNFVVGKGSVDYFVDIVRETPLVKSVSPVLTNAPVLTASEPETTETADEDKLITTPFMLTDYVVRSSDAVSATSINMYVKVATANGVEIHGSSSVSVICVEGSNMIGDTPVTPATDDPIVVDTGEVDEDDNIYSVIQNMTATASSKDNFIFVGKGWGHGVGMSQYGAYDLGVLGYSYSDILNMYFDGIEIEQYANLK